MSGLILRYCAACNSPTSCTEQGECGECGGEVQVVDAFALVPALGNKLDVGQREAALDRASGRRQAPEGA